MSKSVTMELDSNYHHSNIPKFFLEIIDNFKRYLNEKEKKKLEKYEAEINKNIEALYDKIANKDAKEAIKEVKAADTRSTIS